MEINIIKGDLTLQKNLSSNPQLFCKLSKNYKIIPELNINNLYEIKYKEIIMDYLKKRYKNKKYEINEEYNVVINTQIKNLLISEEQSKLYYDEFKTNLKDI